MPIGSAAFAAGPYSVSYLSSAMGLMKGDQQSPSLRFHHKGQRIDNTNIYGNSLIGWIYLGRDVFFNAVIEEWKAATLAALFPFGSNFGQVGVLGKDAYDLAGSLVLTAATGSLAASTGPATITASKAALAPDFPIDALMGPPLREIPISMALMEYASGGAQVNLTFT